MSKFSEKLKNLFGETKTLHRPPSHDNKKKWRFQNDGIEHLKLKILKYVSRTGLIDQEKESKQTIATPRSPLGVSVP